MLIPRFSLRTLVVVMTAAAILSSAGTFAVRGHDWAMAISVVLLSIVSTLALHAVFFLIGWGMSYVRGAERMETSTNAPGRSDPPAQLVRPLDPD